MTRYPKLWHLISLPSNTVVTLVVDLGLVHAPEDLKTQIHNTIVVTCFMNIINFNGHLYFIYWDLTPKPNAKVTQITKRPEQLYMRQCLLVGLTSNLMSTQIFSLSTLHVTNCSDGLCGSKKHMETVTCISLEASIGNHKLLSVKSEK